MICPRFGRRLLIGLGTPVTVWLAIVAFLPTGWARARLAGRLERATGKAVRVEALRLGICGGVHLRNLQIGEPGDPESPWLTAARVRINVSPLHLICGHCEPTKLVVDGLSLRVHRLRDGRMEFAGVLTQPWPDEPRGGDGNTERAEDAAARALELEVRSGRIDVIDEPSATQLELTAVHCAATWEPGKLAVQRLSAQLNGGVVELAAQLDRSGFMPLFEGQIRAQNVNMAGGMGALAYLLPVLAETPDALEGRLALNLYLRGQGADRESFKRSLVGQGNASIDPLRVDNTKFVADLCTQLGVATRTHLGALRSQFSISQGRIQSDQLTLALGPLPVVLTGWTDFDGRLDYRLRQDALIDKLPQEARDLISELPISLEDRVDVHLTGTLADLTVTVDGVSTTDGQPGSATRQATGHLRSHHGAASRRGRVVR